MSQELQEYIAQARKVGKSDEEIVKELLNTGWKMKDINEAMTQKSGLIQPPKPNNIPIKQLASIVILGLVVLFGFFAFMLTGLNGGGPSEFGWFYLIIFSVIPGAFLIKKFHMLLSSEAQGIKGMEVNLGKVILIVMTVVIAWRVLLFSLALILR